MSESWQAFETKFSSWNTWRNKFFYPATTSKTSTTTNKQLKNTEVCIVWIPVVFAFIVELFLSFFGVQYFVSAVAVLKVLYAFLQLSLGLLQRQLETPFYMILAVLNGLAPPAPPSTILTRHWTSTWRMDGQLWNCYQGQNGEKKISLLTVKNAGMLHGDHILPAHIMAALL